MEKTVKENIVYSGKILKLRVDDALSAQGKPCRREFVCHSGGVGVLAVREQELLLVRQYRYAYGEDLWEIPAGKKEVGEDPLMCGKRELAEETGYTAAKWQSLGEMYPSPGYTNEVINVFVAQDLVLGETNFDEDEDIALQWVSLSRALEMIASGEIKDAKTQLAILRFQAGLHA